MFLANSKIQITA